MSSHDERLNSLRHRSLLGWRRGVFILLCLSGILLSLIQIFYILNPFGISIYDISYYYAILAAFLSPVFILFPPSKTSPRDVLPWYDAILFLATFCICIYFAIHGLDIFNEGWVFSSPTLPTVFGLILCLAVVESVRRTAGYLLASISLFFLIFPTFASLVPSPFSGVSFSFWKTISMQSMGSDSLVGMPIWVFSTMLIGFMVFGVAMVVTGGAEFFINLSYALLGGTRGGPAKVAIFASGLFGSLSGAAVSNVLTTGAITIPAMKKLGYPSHYAAAVETNASTGGVLLPPVMGAVAFIMAMWLGVPYATVCGAALIPALLYFFALLMQIDAFAAKKKFRGLDRSEIPSLLSTLKKGWPFIIAFLILIWFLVFLRLEGQAPFYATLVLIVIAAIRKEKRLKLTRFLSFIEQSGKVLVELIAIFAGVSLMIGGLIMTGVSSAFASEITALAGNNDFLLMILGAVTALILGTGMPVITCYIFLGLVLTPALTNLGYNILGVHLFVMYYAMLSFITPPLCIAAFAAAGLAGASPIKTGLQAMRLGTVTYFIPFFFVLNPAMIAQEGTLGTILYVVITAAVGIVLICGALEGYIWGIGRINWVVRSFTIIAGFMLAIPEKRSDLWGAILAIVCLGITAMLTSLMKKKRSDPKLEP